MAHSLISCSDEDTKLSSYHADIPLGNNNLCGIRKLLDAFHR